MSTNEMNERMSNWNDSDQIWTETGEKLSRLIMFNIKSEIHSLIFRNLFLSGDLKLILGPLGTG